MSEAHGRTEHARQPNSPRSARSSRPAPWWARASSSSGRSRSSRARRVGTRSRRRARTASEQRRPRSFPQRTCTAALPRGAKPAPAGAQLAKYGERARARTMRATVLTHPAAVQRRARARGGERRARSPRIRPSLPGRPRPPRRGGSRADAAPSAAPVAAAAVQERAGAAPAPRGRAADDRAQRQGQSATRRGSRSSRPASSTSRAGRRRRVSFSLEDADLPELVRVIGELTGKRFIFGGKVHNIKATVFSPQKVTVAEAYQAFLSILEANGLTVVPHGRFYKIVDSPDAKMGAPVYVAGPGRPGRRPLRHAPPPPAQRERRGGRQRPRPLQVEGRRHRRLRPGQPAHHHGHGHQHPAHDAHPRGRRRRAASATRFWIEPIHYGMASDIAQRLDEVFDIKGGSSGGGGGKAGEKGAARRRRRLGSDVHVTKILADDRSNSLVIIATERAYLRILEFIKRLDVPSERGRGRDPRRRCSSTRTRWSSRKTLNDIITGAQAAAGGAGARPRRQRPPSATRRSRSSSRSVKVSADKATNSIVVTSSLRDFANLRTVIDQLDQPRRQVFIEAVIMDLTIDRQNQLGMAFNGGAAPNTTLGSTQGRRCSTAVSTRSGRSCCPARPTRRSTRSRSASAVPASRAARTSSAPASPSRRSASSSTRSRARTTPTSSRRRTSSRPTTSPPRSTSARTSRCRPTSAASAASPGSAGAAGAAAGALGRSRRARRLRRRRGAAPGHRHEGEDRPAPQRLGRGPPRGERGDQRRRRASSRIGTLGVIPFAKRTAQTQLVVKDQQTVVIGGLMRSRVARTDTKIPLLGDIPVLGRALPLAQQRARRSRTSSWCSRRTSSASRRTCGRVFERKMQERQEFLDHYFVFARAERVRAAEGLLAHERAARGHPAVVSWRSKSSGASRTCSARAR